MKKLLLTIIILTALAASFFYGGESIAEMLEEEPVVRIEVTTDMVEDDLDTGEIGFDEVINPEDILEEIMPEKDVNENNFTDAEIEEETIILDAENDSGERYCTLTIRCDVLLDNLENLPTEKLSLVPEDGIILAEKDVVFYEGESVFNVLVREMKLEKIHMEYADTPLYNSAYIEGIGNIYEFDCGALSGWMYSVNGWFPNYGASQYVLSEGDEILWIYTCNMGLDIGAEDAAESQLILEEEAS